MLFRLLLALQCSIWKSGDAEFNAQRIAFPDNRVQRVPKDFLRAARYQYIALGTVVAVGNSRDSPADVFC
jgi:hypothetical protein